MLCPQLFQKTNENFSWFLPLKSFYFYLPSPIVSLKKKAGQQIRCLVCLRFCLKFVYTFHSTRTNRSSLKINKWVFDMIEWFSFIAIISFVYLVSSLGFGRLTEILIFWKPFILWDWELQNMAWTFFPQKSGSFQLSQDGHMLMILLELLRYDGPTRYMVL